MQARAGDHLMTPFQCDECHFQNIMGRNPSVLEPKDSEILEYIRRATLDAFWDRSNSTVNSNRRAAHKLESFGESLGLPSMAPPMGPFPLRDDAGMRIAIGILNRSLDPGSHEEYVQWATFRKTRSVITNVSQAGVGGLTDSIASYERNRLWISNVPTHQFWFTRFMSGIHKRVGEVRKQDEPISIDVLHSVHRILDYEWKKANTPAQRKRAAEMGVWFICGFCSGLRGEEMVLIERAGTLNSLSHLDDPSDPHFRLVVSGVTKGNQLQGAKFAIPIVGVTEGTNLQPGLWMRRLKSVLEETGAKHSRLFTRRLNPPKLYEFENDFMTVLEKVQATTRFIGSEVDVRDDYGILRTLRRGVTSHARNMGVGDALLKIFNRWRTEMNSNGIATLDMIDTYSKLSTLVPTLLKFSRPQ
jgi:hypothetical protein